MFFEPGDHVVYPAYGAGTVVSLEERVFSGTSTCFYILEMVASEGEFMIPVDQAEALGLRPVVKRDMIQRTLESPPEVLADDYKERQANIEKLIATSDALQLAVGARDLAWFSGSRSLTGRDIQLFEALQTQLASELTLVEGIDLNEAREHLGAILTSLAERAAQEQAERDALAEE